MKPGDRAVVRGTHCGQPTDEGIAELVRRLDKIPFGDQEYWQVRLAGADELQPRWISRADLVLDLFPELDDSGN